MKCPSSVNVSAFRNNTFMSVWDGLRTLSIENFPKVHERWIVPLMIHFLRVKIWSEEVVT